MNDGSPENPAALDELEKFVALLNRFRIVCGRPSLRELSRVSEQVKAYYGQRYPQLPALLSLTALSDVLNRRRKNPPAWSWVALYVLSCQRFAAEAGLRHDPEDATLPIWNLRLQAVSSPDVVPPADEDIVPEQAAQPARSQAPRAEDSSSAREGPLSAPVPLDYAGRAGQAGRAGRTDPAAHVDDLDGVDDLDDDIADEHRPQRAPEPRIEPRIEPESKLGPAPPTAIATQVMELVAYVGEADGPSLSEQRFFAMYGQHGVQLLRAAEARRDPDAEYRLGVLLCVDDRPNEAMAFLLRAEAGGHPEASELIESPAPRRSALVHAWKIGAADASGDAESAFVYLERAARGGHAGAAFELGTLHMEREEAERAADWFATAAECGHPLADWWSDLSRLSRRGGSTGSRPASMPTVDELMTRLYGDPPAGLLR